MRYYDWSTFARRGISERGPHMHTSAPTGIEGEGAGQAYMVPLKKTKNNRTETKQKGQFGSRVFLEVGFRR